MPRPSFGEVSAAIVDPMLSDSFLFEIPNIPGGGNANPLRLLCRTATKPGMTINAVEAQLFGHTIEYAGNMTFSHEMSMEYLENRRGDIHTVIEPWMYLCRDPLSQTGEYKNVYSTSAFLSVFDQKQVLAKQWKITGVWPTSIGDVSFDGQAANIIAATVGWKYDKYEIIL